jgi:hypothetical protein
MGGTKSSKKLKKQCKVVKQKDVDADYRETASHNQVERFRRILKSEALSLNIDVVDFSALIKTDPVIQSSVYRCGTVLQ